MRGEQLKTGSLIEELGEQLKTAAQVSKPEGSAAGSHSNAPAEDWQAPSDGL